MDTDTNISHKNVLESMPFGVVQVDLSGIVVYANTAAFKLLGLTNKSDLVGIHYDSFQHDQYGRNGKRIKKEDHALYAVLHQQRVVTSSVQGILVNGETRWFSINAAPIYNDENVLVGAISNFADITAKIEEDVQKQQAADRYRIFVENINAVVWETKIGSQTFSYISPKVSEIFGFPQKDWLEEGFWQSRIYEKDREHVIAYERHKAPNLKDYKLEYRIVHKNGSLVWVRDLVEVVTVDDKPKFLRGLMLDITDQKYARSLLKESEQQYKQMIAEAPYAISIYNKDGLLIAANPKSSEYWQADLANYVGKFNIFENDLFTKEAQIETIKKAFNGERGEVTAKVPLTHSGESRHFRIKYYPLFNTANELDSVVYISEDITEYVKAEKKIKQEEALKKGILDALDEAILVVDENGIVISINKNLRAYVKNRSFADLNIGRSVFDFIEYFDESDFLIHELQSILNQEVRVLDHEIKLADGMWYNMRATPLDMPFGAVIAWQNINTRKEIEMALEKSLRKYRSIYNKAPVMMHSINENLEIVSVSDFWLEKMGYERNEVIGKTPYEFHAEYSKEIEVNLKKLFAEGSVKNIAYKYKKKSGEIMEVLLSAVAEYDENGNFERSITGMLDVTDLKVAERQLQESQYRLLESQRISKIANYEYDPNADVFEPSEEMISMMGLSKAKRDISIIQGLVHPDDIPELTSKLEKSIREAKDFFHVYRIKHQKTFKTKWISSRGRMIKDENGNTIRMIGTVQDITEQKAAEQKIKRLTDRVVLATEIANIGVWEYDREANEIFWEEQMYSIFSNTKVPLSLRELKKYFIDEDQKIIEEGLKMIHSGINFLEGEARIVIDNEKKYLRSFTRILRDHNGKPRGMIGVIYDITTDKNLQMELESSLEEKNVLVKEVHHRVKNNMQLISSILALKSYDLVDDKSKEIFTEVNDRIKAMSVIHDNLYSFKNVSEIDIEEYLKSITGKFQLLQGTSKVKISVFAEKIILDVEKALLIGLVVSELVGNALKHGFAESKRGKIVVHFTKEGKKHILKVMNTGEKIPEDVLDSASGLGVSLIKTFTNQLDGEVEVDERNGFKLSF